MATNEVLMAAAKGRGLSEADAVKATLRASKGDDGFVDMKKPKVKTSDKESGCCPSFDDDNRYPYGLQLRFDEDSLEKLGMDEDNLPTVGDTLTLTVKAVVESVSSRKNTKGDDTCNVEMQVQKIKVGA